MPLIKSFHTTGTNIPNLKAFLNDPYVGYNKFVENPFENVKKYEIYSTLLDLGNQLFGNTNGDKNIATNVFSDNEKDKDKLSLMQLKVKTDISSVLTNETQKKLNKKLINII